MSAVFGALLVAAAAQGAPAASAKTPEAATLDACLKKANTTLDSNECFAADAKAAEVTLGRYTAAARVVLKDESIPADTFEKGEAAWKTYRTTYCNAVYDRWADGTIRDAQTLGCQATVTRDHTHQIWSDYLLHMDSSKPVLPEPK